MSIDLNITTQVSSDTKVYYRVIQKLGDGGNSVVYLVECVTGPNFGVLFAMKVFTKLSNETRHQRFLQEIKTLQECSHPSVMKIYDTGLVSTGARESLQYPFLIADYLPHTLRGVMGSFSMADKLAFCLQMLSALSYLSKLPLPIIHRDIKPENIFVRGKSFLLGDFGLIKTVGSTDVGDADFIIESEGPRLPRFYRTPDLVNYCRGQGVITPKSDVFQLGLVFAEVFTGENPLIPCAKILDPVVINEVRTLPTSQGVSIQNVIMRMLEEDPNRRGDAFSFFDHWEGIFIRVVKDSHELEGKVF